MFTATWGISSGLHGLFQRFAPSNIVIRRVHTRRGLKWGPLVGLAGVAVYGFVMILAVGFLDRGAPGWVHLIFFVAFWSALKFAALIPASIVRLLWVRHLENATLRAYRRAQAAWPTDADDQLSYPANHAWPAA